MDGLFEAVIYILNINRSYDRAIEQAITHIRDSYSSKKINTVNATLIDYSRFEYQCAYIFLYFTSHVNFIHKLLDSFYEDETLVRNFFLKHRGAIRVCSLGGGPGSEIFGLNSFYKERFGNCNVFGDILDRHISWEYMFENLIKKIKADNLTDVLHEPFDFLSDVSIEEAKQYIERANLVTLVKFISVVAYDRTSAKNKLTNLLKSVKSGAIVLFVDNYHGGYLEMMNRSATAANLQLISQVERQFRISKSAYSNEKAILGRFADRHSPQKCARVAASIWYKTETIIVSNSTGSNVNPTTHLSMFNIISPTIHAATQTSEFTSFLDKSTQTESNPPLQHKCTQVADPESMETFLEESKKTIENSDSTSIENVFGKLKPWATILRTMLKIIFCLVTFLFTMIRIIFVKLHSCFK